MSGRFVFFAYVLQSFAPLAHAGSPTDKMTVAQAKQGLLKGLTDINDNWKSCEQIQIYDSTKGCTPAPTPLPQMQKLQEGCATVMAAADTGMKHDVVTLPVVGKGSSYSEDGGKADQKALKDTIRVAKTSFADPCAKDTAQVLASKGDMDSLVGHYSDSGCTKKIEAKDLKGLKQSVQNIYDVCARYAREDAKFLGQSDTNIASTDKGIGKDEKGGGGGDMMGALGAMLPLAAMLPMLMKKDEKEDEEKEEKKATDAAALFPTESAKCTGDAADSYKKIFEGSYAVSFEAKDDNGTKLPHCKCEHLTIKTSDMVFDCAKISKTAGPGLGTDADSTDNSTSTTSLGTSVDVDDGGTALIGKQASTRSRSLASGSGGRASRTYSLDELAKICKNKPYPAEARKLCEEYVQKKQSVLNDSLLK